MLRFIEGHDLIDQYKKLVANQSTASLAVAFWGKGAASKFKITKPTDIRIICNLESGACNPDEIEKMRALVQIKTHPRLHAKVYITSKGAIIGSSNASANGLAISAEDAKAWNEANIVTDDSVIMERLREWFERMWKQAHSIKTHDIERARQLWKIRRQLAPAQRKGKSLLEALSADPESLEAAKIFCIAWCEPLDKGANAIAEELSAKGTLKDAMFYQPVRAFEADSWLIRCDFQKRTPAINGYASVPNRVVSWASPAPDERPLYAAFPERNIRIGSQSYTLSPKEKAFLLRKLKKDPRVTRAWRTGDAVIPLQSFIS